MCCIKDESGFADCRAGDVLKNFAQHRPVKTRPNTVIVSANDNRPIKTFEDCHEKLYEIMDENDKKCNTNNEANNEVDLSGVAKYLCIHPDKIPENYLKTGGDLKPFWSDNRIEPMNAYYNYAKCRNETNGCEKSVKIENDECAKTHNILEYKDQICIIQ